MAIPCLPGFREFYPQECALRNHLFRIWRAQARCSGFEEFDAPVLEPLELFTVKSGDEIVSQLFWFEDRGGRKVALRPEMTPSLARLVGARAGSLRRPVKWFSIGENYRYERPQKGRLRAFYQLNADILGESSSAADAEVIGLLIQTLCSCGLDAESFCLRLSDRSLWWLFLESQNLTPPMIEAVLGVIDKIERESRGKSCERLDQIVGSGRGTVLMERLLELIEIRDLAELERWLREHSCPTVIGRIEQRLGEWRDLIADLDARGWGAFVRIDLSIVRGLAYYTGFVFEAFQTVGSGRAIAGGGRYDDLVAKLGGPDLPAVGFGMGDVVLGELLGDLKRLPAVYNSVDVYVISLGAAARPAALADLTRIRSLGIAAEISLRDAALGKQFKAADQAGARWGLIYGDDEVKAGTVRLRDLRQRNESVIPRARLAEALQAAMQS